MKTVTINVTEDDLAWDGNPKHLGYGPGAMLCPGYRAAKRAIPDTCSFAFHSFSAEVMDGETSRGALTIRVPEQAGLRLISHALQQIGKGGEKTGPFSFEVLVPDEIATR